MIHTIYNNYYSSEKEADARKYLFDEHGEDEGWSKPEDVPDDKVYAEMAAQDDMDWDEESAELKKFIDKDYFLIVGTFGSWRGALPSGKLVRSYNDLSGAWRQCDYINIYDENGHLYIECSHHDGTNHYEVKRLTTKGYEYLQNGWREHDQKAHEIAFNNNLFSALPHYAHQVFGCKKYA